MTVSRSEFQMARAMGPARHAEEVVFSVNPCEHISHHTFLPLKHQGVLMS